MAVVSVTPQQYVLCAYDPARIAELVDRAATLVGFGRDEPIVVDVDETTPLLRVNVVSTDPVTLHVEGGAFEDPRVPRHLGEQTVLANVGGPLFRAWDMRQPAFAEAPGEAKLTLGQRAAWDVYTVGRCARVGLPAQRQRRLYSFRNRHGFTDATDRVFDRLWLSDGLTWADILAACNETVPSNTNGSAA